MCEGDYAGARVTMQVRGSRVFNNISHFDHHRLTCMYSLFYLLDFSVLFICTNDILLALIVYLRPALD